MIMTFEEMEKAISDAKYHIRLADNFTGQMAKMIAGKLRANNVSGYTLQKLKKELKKFNMHTMDWKD